MLAKFTSSDDSGLGKGIEGSDYANNSVGAPSLDAYNSSSSGCPNGGESDLDKAHVRIILIAVFVLVFIVCFLGNALLLLVISCHKGMRTVTNFFLGNLAVADLFVGLFCVLQYLVHVHGMDSGQWPLGEFLCKMYLFVLHFGPCASAGILILVSLERYVAVLYPVMARDMLTKTRLGLLTAMTWTLSIAVSVPYFINSRTFSFGSGSVVTCGRSSDDGGLDFRAMVLVHFLLWYVAPVSIMTFIYVRIGWVLWKSTQHGIAASQNRMSQRRVTSRPSLSSHQRQHAHDHVDSNGSHFKRGSGRANGAYVSMQLSESEMPLCAPHQTNGSASQNGHSHRNGSLSDDQQNGRPLLAVSSNGTTRNANGCHSSAPRRQLSSCNSMRTKSNGSATLSIKSIRNANVMETDAVEARKKVIRLLVVVIAAFAILTLPQQLRLVWLFLLRPANYNHCNVGLTAFLQPIAYFLLFLNSAINPLLYAFLSRGVTDTLILIHEKYAFLSKKFRVAVKEVFSCTTQREQKRIRYLETMNRGTTTMSELYTDDGGSELNTFIFKEEALPE